MPLPLEDSYLDVINKAQRGLAIPDARLTHYARISHEALIALKSGQELNEAVLHAVAMALALKPVALINLARGLSVPPEPDLPELATFKTPFRDMTVNAYLVEDPSSDDVALFDTGTDAGPILDLIKLRKKRLAAIFLTHTHGDHIVEMDYLIEKTGAPCYANEREPLAGAQPFPNGRKFQVGNMRIETRLTFGHSAGGTTYLIASLAQPLALVGDALFACSMGAGGYSYGDAIRTNRDELLALDGNTVLCPGHGPLTTVDYEREHNPFFP